MRRFNPDSKLPLLTLVCVLSAQPLAANTVEDGLSEPAPQVQTSLPRYLQSRSAQFVDWLSDGSLLIATRFGDTQQIHRVSRPLGAREQVSFAAGGVVAAQARPYASDALVYLESLHGGQSDQLFLQRLDTHELTALTDGNHRDGAARWAHDGKHLAFASNRLDSAGTAIYELDTDASAAVPRLLAGGAGDHWRLLDWSGDDKRVLLGREPGTAAASVQLFIVDVDSGEITPVGSAQAAGKSRAGSKGIAALAAVSVHDARFATDGHGIVMLTTQSAPGQAAASAPDAVRLVYLDLHSEQWHDLSSSGSHDVQQFAQSADGRYIAYTLRENGLDRLMLIDQTRKLDLSVPQLPAGLIGNLKFDQSGQRLGLSIESTRSPADAWVYEPETHALTQWTRSEVGPIDTTHFTVPTPLRFATWDRIDGKPRELSALVYRSAGADAAGPRPVVIVLCAPGGSQCEPGFEPFLQFLVNELGVVVVAPAMRTEPSAADELGEDTVRDVGSLLVWIGLQRELDRSRIALLGEGIGGYVALQALADYGDRLRAAVAAFAPHQSVLGHASAIRRPLLLVQGLNNPSAPAYELDQLGVRLRAQGVEVQSLAASEEGAAFDRESNRDAYRAAAANFLFHWLR
jgi:dipeptidyl aminopeptidase/acylaminoacyl peptidase